MAACTDAKQKIKDAYVRLTNLNVTSLVGALYSQDVITARQKQIIGTKIIESEKMMYLLDDIIIPSLEAGTLEKFKSFREVMEKSDDSVIKSVCKRLSMLMLCYNSKVLRWTRGERY